MSKSDKSKSQAVPSYYDVNYSNFQTELYSDIRRDAFGEDIGQNSWLTVSEQDMFLSWLDLSPGKMLLDVACGSGGPALRMAKRRFPRPNRWHLSPTSRNVRNFAW
jgi:cyclopropane fatty-acyl-phospholipid synthase-like methyltransferase